MRVERPFCIALRHEGSAMLLFLGAIADPGEAAHPAVSASTGLNHSTRPVTGARSGPPPSFCQRDVPIGNGCPDTFIFRR